MPYLDDDLAGAEGRAALCDVSSDSIARPPPGDGKLLPLSFFNIIKYASINILVLKM